MQHFFKKFWWLFSMKKPIEQAQPRKRPLYEVVEELDYKVDTLLKLSEDNASRPGIMLVAPGVSLDPDPSDVEPFEPFESVEGEAPSE